MYQTTEFIMKNKTVCLLMMINIVLLCIFLRPGTVVADANQTEQNNGLVVKDRQGRVRFEIKYEPLLDSAVMRFYDSEANPRMVLFSGKNVSSVNMFSSEGVQRVTLTDHWNGPSNLQFSRKDNINNDIVNANVGLSLILQADGQSNIYLSDHKDTSLTLGADNNARGLLISDLKNSSSARIGIQQNKGRMYVTDQNGRVIDSTP